MDLHRVPPADDLCRNKQATISVAGIDLVYLGLKLMLTSIETARRESRFGVAEFGSATNIAEEKLDGDL